MELDVAERLPRAMERELTLGRAIRVVERGLRCAALRDETQVVDREGGSEPPPAAVEIRLLERHEFQELRGPRELALDHSLLLRQRSRVRPAWA